MPKTSMNAQAPPHDSLRFVTDDEAKHALLRVFERAREVKDPNGGRVLVMLVSRRLACLYEMLVASGQVRRFDSERFEVVTDRVLDTLPEHVSGEAALPSVGDAGYRLSTEPPPQWNGRRTVLIDDVINLGSTLVDRYDDLVKLVGGAHLVTALVALKDRARCNADFVEHLKIESEKNGSPLERTEHELKELARQFATCLYRSLTPYFTDFPIFKPVQVQPEVIENLIGSHRWLAADVTAPIANKSQRAYSFIAAEDTEDRIRRKAVAAAVEHAELFKVRAYTTDLGDGSLSVRIVPICVPGEVMPSRLDRALEELEEVIHDEGDSGLTWRAWQPRAKHRLLQMYLSACLAQEFLHDLRECGADADEINANMFEGGHLGSYFGEQPYDGVRSAFAHAMRAYRDSPGNGATARDELPLQMDSLLWLRPEVRQHALYTADLAAGSDDYEADEASAAPSRPSAGSAVRLDRHKLWVQRILNIFGEIDRTLERPQAKQLRDLPYEDYVRYRSDPAGFPDIGPRVLHQGIRPREITEAVLGDGSRDELWRRVVATLALDIGNDLGVAVPTTIGGDWHDPVSRQFRSGEGAFLADLSHARFRTVAPENAVEKLDALTRDAFGLPLTGDLDDDERQRAIDRIGKQARRIRDIPGDRLLQLWIGVVREVQETSFVADFVTTIGGADYERVEFEIEATLGKRDQKRLTEDALIEWSVYESQLDGIPVRSRRFRLASTAEPGAD